MEVVEGGRGSGWVGGWVAADAGDACLLLYIGLDVGKDAGGAHGEVFADEVVALGGVVVVDGVEFALGGVGVHIAAVVAPTG